MVGGTKARAVHRLFGGVANAKSHVANDNVVRAISARTVICEANSITGRRLPRDGAIRITNRAWLLQMNQARDAKNNSPRTVRIDRGAQTSRDHRFAFG